MQDDQVVRTAPSISERVAARLGGRSDFLRKLFRYGMGSVVATVCSWLAFMLFYGAFNATPAVSSVVAWLAGAIPNYFLNRAWAWERSGRPSFRRELLPYITIVLGTLLVAIVATSIADRLVHQADLSHAVSSLVVSGTYTLVYVLMFVLRFFLFDRLFTSLSRHD